MKKIFSEKGSMIAKLIVYQIAMSIFGVMLAFAITALNVGLLLATGVFSALFYFALAGAALNEDGLRDNVSVTRDGSAANAFIGLKYALISFAPTLIITLLYAILCTLGVNNSLTSILNIFIRFFLSGMYLSLDTSLFSAGETVMAFSANGYSFLIYQVVSVIICGVFYYIGFKGINLLPKKKEDN